MGHHVSADFTLNQSSSFLSEPHSANLNPFLNLTLNSASGPCFCEYSDHVMTLESLLDLDFEEWIDIDRLILAFDYVLDFLCVWHILDWHIVFGNTCTSLLTTFSLPRTGRRLGIQIPLPTVPHSPSVGLLP